MVGFIVLLIGLLIGPGGIPPAEAACGGSPLVTTDKRDYGPTEAVRIAGRGFNCGAELSVLVTAPDGSTRSADGTGAAGPDAVVADDNGAFVLTYQLSGTLADGTGYRGQHGIYQVEVRDGSTTILADTTFSDGVGGWSCGLSAAGGVKCWGSLPGNLTSATPVDVPELSSGVTQVTVGGTHACALTTVGGVKCWGFSEWGQLGNGTRQPCVPDIITACFSATPVDVTGLTSGVVQISAGGLHTCALTTAGGVKCWGDFWYGQVGNGKSAILPNDSTPTPVDVTGLTSGVAQISAGGLHTCAVTTAGGAKCWGRSTVGQVGNGAFTCNTRGCGFLTPVDVTTLTSGVAQISSGGNHTCAVTTAGGVKCWGDFWNGQLGTVTCPIQGQCGKATAVDVNGLSTGVAQVRAGQDHTCALTVAGGVKCWGRDDFGQMGNGTFIYGELEPNSFIVKSPFGSATPTDVIGLASGVAQISLAYAHTCALTTSGIAKCWGGNIAGQLGNGTTTPNPPGGIPRPVDVVGLPYGIAALWDNEPLVPWSLAMDFGPSGIWLLRGTTWRPLHPYSAKAMFRLPGWNRDRLIIDFGDGLGLWFWEQGPDGEEVWFQLHALSPSVMAGIDLDGNGEAEAVVFNFTGYGLWLYDSNTGHWSQLHGTDASQVVAVNLDSAAGDELIVDFPGFGLWVYAAGAWSSLHQSDVSSIVAADIDGNGRKDLVMNFPGFGVWSYMNGATWEFIHEIAAKHLAAADLDGNGMSDLVFDFGAGVGVWIRRNRTTWTFLHASTTENIVAADLDWNGKDEVILDFGAQGVWSYEDGREWVRVHPLNPGPMATGRLR